MPTLTPVTDLAVLQQLDGSPALTPVTDPKLVKQLEAKEYSATDDMSAAEKFTAGVGGAMHHLFQQGIPQLAYRALGAISGPENNVSSLVTGDHRNRWDRKADDIAREYANERETEAPLNADPYGLAGNVAGNIVSTLPAGAPGVIGSMALGGALGAAQPTAPGESRGENTLTGAGWGGAGAAASKVLGRIAVPVQNKLDEYGRSAVSALQSAGVPLDLAQRTGSEFLQRIKRGLSDAPVTSGWARENTEAQRRATTAALLRTIGADSDRASPGVMAEAKQRIGSVFNDVAERNPVQFDTGLASDVQRAQEALTRTVPESSHGPILAQIRDLFSSAAENGGKIDGKVLQRVQSDLGNMTRNPDYGQVAGDLRSALSSALERSAGPEDAAALAAARVKYRNLKQIEGAITNDEQISPKVLANAIRRRPRNVNQGIYGAGDQEVPTIAKAAAAVLPETTANSGTPAGHAALATLGAGGAIAAPLLYTAGHSFLSGEPMDSDSLKEAGRRSAEVAALIAAMKAGKFAFESKPVSNYLVNGIGGAANSGQAARLTRQAFTLPETNKALAHALRIGAASYGLLPGAAQQ